MAWNEPGGGKDRDPWGGRGGDQGPPDLDEALRRLQSQLAGIFGGRGGGSGGGGSRSVGVNPRLLAAVLGLAAIAYVFFGFYQVDEGERAVVFRFGAVKDDVVMPGLHWYPSFIESIRKVNVTRVNSHPHQALMLTEDENIVDVKLTVQYVIDSPKDYIIKVRNPEISLEHATESALRHAVGGARMDEVITEGRAAIAVEVQERLQSYLNRYGTGILISKVNIDQSVPPKQVVDAFNDVQRAKEDEARVINEAKAYGEGVIPEARGDAQKEIQQATAYRDQVIARAEGEAQRFSKLLAEYRSAKEITRDRLYIDAIESVLSNSSKVLVDVEGGNNVLYLPLDRLSQQRAASIGDQEAQSVADSIVRNAAERSSTDRRTSR
jgi:membrane protease subunit HflK